MTAEQLRKLENDLWEAADQLRANSKLTATEYTMPVLVDFSAPGFYPV
jgi:type I restriction enzyme M protein